MTVADERPASRLAQPFDQHMMRIDPFRGPVPWKQRHDGTIGLCNRRAAPDTAKPFENTQMMGVDHQRPFSQRTCIQNSRRNFRPHTG